MEAKKIYKFDGHEIVVVANFMKAELFVDGKLVDGAYSYQMNEAYKNLVCLESDIFGLSIKVRIGLELTAPCITTFVNNQLMK